MIRRVVSLLLFLFVLFILACRVQSYMQDNQLQLFHWRNASAEDQPFGPIAANRLPIHEGGLVWGRSGFHWVQSVIAYLSWREGASWRPDYHRFHPVREHFIECIAIVQRAYFGNVKWWSAAGRGRQIACVICRRPRQERRAA